jgi:hypothetical protein
VTKLVIWCFCVPLSSPCRKLTCPCCPPPLPCRKFVKKSILEDPARGLLLNDTIIIQYQIELVVSTGGALARQITNERPSKSVVVPPPNLGSHMLRLFEDRLHTDVVFEVESNQLAAHKIILSARSPVFKALLTGPMLEGASFISSFPSSLPTPATTVAHMSTSHSICMPT